MHHYLLTISHQIVHRTRTTTVAEVVAVGAATAVAAASVTDPIRHPLLPIITPTLFQLCSQRNPRGGCGTTVLAAAAVGRYRSDGVMVWRA